MDAPDGIDSAQVTNWFVENVPATSPPLGFDLIAAGHSNLTFRVSDQAGNAWVLRRPPLHQVLATAHDMGREYRIITALHGTIPVPRSLGLCEDETVNERPFYVMDFVDGLVLRDEHVALEAPVELRRAAGRSLVRTLAQLHSLDPDDVGLGDLGRKEDYVARQLKRWLRQYEASTAAGRPAIVEVHDHLVAHIPEQVATGIVHGDYRLDNCMVDAAGEVMAVLDWELCTLGDVMADVAMLLAYWTEPGDEPTVLADSPTLAPGFLTRDEVVAEYEQAAGKAIPHLDFYLAFANWRLACILEGVYSRYVGGAMGDKDAAGVDGFRVRIDACIGRAEAHAAQVA